VSAATPAAFKKPEGNPKVKKIVPPPKTITVDR